MTIERPEPAEYAPYYAGYLALVPEPDILAVLEAQIPALTQLASRAPEGKHDFRYAPDKWSVGEVFGHIIDTERVFGHRLFCVSRGERASLPGFDENEYVKESRPLAEALEALGREFAAVREANLFVVRRLDSRISARMGTANGTPVSARAQAYIMAGHVRHHLAVLADRYRLA